jgi:hypothetical protein
MGCLENVQVISSCMDSLQEMDKSLLNFRHSQAPLTLRNIFFSFSTLKSRLSQCFVCESKSNPVAYEK